MTDLAAHASGHGVKPLSSPGVDGEMRVTGRLFVAAAAAWLMALTPALSQDDEDEPVSPYPTAEFEEGASSATVTVGDVTATITMQKRPEIDPSEAVPVLAVTAGGRQVIEVPGVASGLSFPATSASIVEIDPGNSRPEVYFTSYSGGAHCCASVAVAEETASGWVAVQLGSFDGGGEFLDDLDGDGVVEISTVDNRFLYTFDCYACSAAPLVILSVRNGEAIDLTADPRFLSAHRRWLSDLEENVEPEERWSSPGFLAGWVATRVRLGEGAAAFAEVQQHWDSASDEGEEVCRTGAELDDCPRADRVTLKFPERLKLFLDQNGYAF